MLTLIKNFDFLGLKSSTESLQATALSQDKHLADWAKSSTSLAWNLGPRMTAIDNSQAAIRTEVSSLRKDTSNIKSMMTEIYQAFKTPKRIDKGKKIASDDVESQVKLVPASRVVQEDPNEPVRVPYMINGKMHYLTNDKITAHLEKEELIKKDAEQARLLAITKPEVVKVVREEAEKIRIGPERITSAKEGEKFKKAQDVELKVLNKERNEKLRKSLKLRKHKYENYMWTIGNKLKPEKITDVKIHPHIKPIVVKVYKSTNRRTFENSISSSCPILEQASSKSLGRKRKHMELEPEIKVPGLDWDRSLPEVIALMIKTLENVRFCLKLKKLIAEHPDQEKLKSKRVKLEALGYKLD
ncbi:hypothetical protein Tco_0153858 [Tanacetum coccineum]